ncbi:MAG: ABC transporter permease [Microbacterium sp.]|uniref:ABC transporter permease n=1 Tax=Microbacterium sp. TaxID=51671 RepID=UPI003BAE8082
MSTEAILVRKRVARLHESAGHTGTLLIVLVGVIVLFSALNPRVFATPLNLQSIGYAVPEIALLALAIALTMSSAGIDLSVVAVANLSSLGGAAVAIAMLQSGMSDPVAALVGILVALVIGLVCGLINGALIAYVRIAPILATLATMTLFTGIAIVLTRGEPLYGLPETTLALGVQTIAIVPLSSWILCVVVALLFLLMNRTGFGLRVLLVGASAEAADYSGIRRSHVLMGTYATAGVIAAIAGVLMSARSASATADYGASYLLLAITIAVLGGTNPSGGRAPIVGVAVAALILQSISSGITGMQISPYIYQIIQGLILVVVLVLESRRGRLGWLSSLMSRPVPDGAALTPPAEPATPSRRERRGARTP